VAFGLLMVGVVVLYVVLVELQSGGKWLFSVSLPKFRPGSRAVAWAGVPE
jgi:hypothetical protein